MEHFNLPISWAAISTFTTIIMALYIIFRNRNQDGAKVEESFKKRIGRQVDDHHEQIELIKKCLIFLVQKAGGNPAEMGLFK